MKIVYATYVDHQEQIKYPLGFIISKIPQLIVYCSDEENRLYLESTGIKAKVIGHKISIPLDISIAQNKCINDIFENENPDFVVWNQADIHITTHGHDIINNFCVESNKHTAIALSLCHIKLFHLCGRSCFGVNAIGKDAWSFMKYSGDGAYINNSGLEYRDEFETSIDIGYLSIEQCKNHLKQHIKTWTSNDPIHDWEDRRFIKEYIKRHNTGGLIKEDSEYYQLISEMGLIEQYNYLKSLI